MLIFNFLKFAISFNFFMQHLNERDMQIRNYQEQANTELAKEWSEEMKYKTKVSVLSESNFEFLFMEIIDVNQSRQPFYSSYFPYSAFLSFQLRNFFCRLNLVYRLTQWPWPLGGSITPQILHFVCEQWESILPQIPHFVCEWNEDGSIAPQISHFLWRQFASILPQILHFVCRQFESIAPHTPHFVWLCHVEGSICPQILHLLCPLQFRYPHIWHECGQNQGIRACRLQT